MIYICVGAFLFCTFTVSEKPCPHDLCAPTSFIKCNGDYSFEGSSKERVIDVYKTFRMSGYYRCNKVN